MSNQPTCELTETARTVIEQVQTRHSGPLAMVVSNGCCDGTAPYLYDHYEPPANAVKMLEADGVSVYLSAFMAGASGDSAHYIVDAVPDPASDSLSLESDFGWRLSVRIELDGASCKA